MQDKAISPTLGSGDAPSLRVEQDVSERIDSLRRSVENVIRGKPEVIDLALVTLLSEGHLLIEDVPGVGKTMLARALARSVDASFRRIQFTSDLLPSDVIGVSVYNPASSDFEFRTGPLFANVVLADEINRSTPKTQSALLEAMNEAQVSVDNASYPLPRPFIVLATQNPVEYHGTYPLPESQLDRFLMCIRMGYPDEESEKQILRSQQLAHPIDTIEPVLSRNDVLRLQKEVRLVRVDAALSDYLVRLAAATRRSEDLRLGVSPRGTLLLQRAAQARALLSGRAFMIPDDIKAVAVPVLAHRVVARARSAAGSGRVREVEAVLEDILDREPIPL